jgi:hypothetical protein
MTDDYSIYIIVSICLSIVMVLIVIYTSSVSKFTPKDKYKYSQINGNVKTLKPIYGANLNIDNKFMFAINKYDQIFIGTAVQSTTRKFSDKVNWIKLPGLFNRATALYRDQENTLITIVALNRNNEIYSAVFKTNGAMVEEWRKTETSENFSDIVDITFTATGMTLIDKDGNMFSMQ